MIPKTQPFADKEAFASCLVSNKLGYARINEDIIQKNQKGDTVKMSNRLPAITDFDFQLASHQVFGNGEYIKKFVIPTFISPVKESITELHSLNFSEDNRILTNKQSHAYFTAYSKLFEPYRNKEKLNLIELGIGSIDITIPSTMHGYHTGIKQACGREYWPGGSLILWDKYFRKKANIIGWDIDVSQARCPDIKVFETNSLIEVKLRETLASTLGYCKKQGCEGIDIFIDDGLHTPESQIKTFKTIFPALNQGGLYVIEDICIPHYRLDAISNSFISCEISAITILEMVMRLSGKEAVLYQLAGEIPACMICIQK